MAALAARIRAARETWVKVRGHEFLLRRPTTLELHSHSGRMGELVFFCVVGWKLRELDLVEGGGGEVPPFDAEAFREWVGDRVEIVTDLADEIQAILKRHNEAREALEKN